METAVLLGANKRVTAGYMGVTYETLRVWLSMGREVADQLGGDDPGTAEPEKAIYLDCFMRFEAARARLAILLLGKIHTHAATDWRAAQTLLEKAFPADYGKRKALDVSADEETVRTLVKVVKGIDVDLV